MQFFSASSCQKLNTLPHDKIIRAQFLKPFVRSAVFIKSVLSEPEKDCRSDWTRTPVCENSKTETRSDDVLVNIHEKRDRLRGETMTPARLNMKPVKIVNRLAVADHPRAHIAAFGFANRTAHPAREAIGQFFNAAAQIECVPVKPGSGSRGELKRFSSPYLKVSPTPFPRETNELVCYKVRRFLIKDEWFAHIAEWKADAAAASEQTAHFHQRNQRHQSVSAGKLEVKRLMVISLVKHLCPGAGVETTRIAMQGNKMVPNRLIDRVKNPHLQRFAGRFRFHKRVVAREWHRFFRL